MQWYYSKNATQMGPVPLEELRAKLAAGEVSATDMAWKEGMPDWRPVSTIPELQIVAPGVPGQVLPGGAAQSPYAPPGTPGAVYVPVRTSGLAIASLVCGISGLFCMFLPGIAAVICGHMALKQIADPNVRMEGRGMAIAGLVLGYLSVAIMVVWLIGIVFSILVGMPRH